ncbi:MAG: glycoside hydrolase, family [Cyanobacteria bacterium RYN_339]|nr:glycoside hydrolase, family [Cyanobacteria bacterium RYN_339]
MSKLTTLASLMFLSALTGCTGEGLIDQYLENYDFKQQVWTKVDVGVAADLSAMQWQDASTGYIVGDQGTVLKTADGGGTWKASNPAAMAGERLLSVSFVSPTLGFVASKGAVYATQDGGATWTKKPAFPKAVGEEILRARFITAGAGYVAGSKKAYQTLDGGETWTPLALINVRDFDATANLVYAGGGNIYRAMVGTGWDGLLSADQACSECSSWINFITAADGWAVITGRGTLTGSQAFAVLRTKDGGGSWTNLPTQNHEGKPLGPYLRGASFDTLRALRFTDAQNGWMIFGGGLLNTYDGGQTWVPQQQDFVLGSNQFFNKYVMENLHTFGLQDLQAVDGKNAWVVGDKGGVYKFTGAMHPIHHEK